MMDEHGSAVLAFCLRVLQNRQAAEDIRQQVFLEAYRDITRFEGRSTLRTWLFRIAANRCKDLLKMRRGRFFGSVVPDEQAVVDFADPAPAPADRIERARLLAALEQCLTVLSEEVRMTVMLRYQTEMSYEDMSGVLKTKADTLRLRVRRAMPLLLQCMEEKGWRDE